MMDISFMDRQKNLIVYISKNCLNTKIQLKLREELQIEIKLLNIRKETFRHCITTIL